MDFYPRPPRGGRREFLRVGENGELFLSTPSARRATSTLTERASKAFYFYPRPPRGGRLLEFCQCMRCFGISIHALREEGDLDSWHYGDNYKISIHALREEGDLPAP